MPHLLSTIDLIHTANRIGLRVKHSFIENESLITRARNNIVEMFLHMPEYTHLMFIDADIKFHAEDVLSLLSICDESYPVIAGIYPKKSISWDLVESAVQAGVPSSELKKFTDHPVINWIVPEGGGSLQIKMGEPVEVAALGTGFMMMRRDVLRQMREKYPELAYSPDYALNTKDMRIDSNSSVCAMFDTEIVEENGRKRYLSEDYCFCHRWRAIGGKVFAAPWVNLVHHGTYHYCGELGAALKLKSWKHQQEQSKKVEPKIVTL